MAFSSKKPVRTAAVLDKLLAATRRSGIRARAELAVSGDFYDVPSAEIARAAKDYESRFATFREELAATLGTATQSGSPNEVTWERDGSVICLALEHPDKEEPIVVSLTATYAGAAASARSSPVACKCSTLKYVRNPFTGGRMFAMRPSILETHERIAETTFEDQGLSLLACRGCRRLYQSDARYYLFEVPPIDTEAWKTQPYAEPGEQESHERALEQYTKTADRRTGDAKCRVSDCPELAVRLSVFCFDHHREGRPKPPSGRPLVVKA